MIKIIKYSTVFIITMLITLVGCTDEVQTGGVNDTLSGEVEFSFRVSVPDPDLSEVQTRAQTLTETRIATADVLVFSRKSGETDYTFDYHTPGTNITTGNPLSEFKAKLTSTSNPVKLYLLANAGTTVADKAALLQPGATETAVKDGLSMAFIPTNLPNNIPLWGEYVFTSGITPQYSRQVSGIIMYRALAKITVSSAMPASQFEITGIHVARGRSHVMLVPKSIDVNGRVSEPHIPAAGTFTQLDPVNITPAISSFYVAEDSGYGTADLFATNSGSNQHTTLIISARVGGVESFYRLDVKHNDTYGRIVRNNHYNISITGVKSQGETSLQAALNVKTPTLLYDTRSFEMGTGLKSIVFDLVEELSAEARQILLMPQAGTRDVPIDPGALNTEVKMARYVEGQPINESSFSAGATLPLIGGSAEIVLISGNPALRITTNSNAGTTDLKEKVMLRTPTKTLVLEIVKKSPSTIGITATVQGALTSPQRAVFTHSGGTKLINVQSSAAWQVEASANWISVRKRSETQLEIATATPQGPAARETSIVIKNEMGQSVPIEIYQEYQLEWSKAYTIGGVHTNDLNQFVSGTYPMKYRRFVPPTQSGTRPLGFATPAGDVNIITPKEVVSPDFPTANLLLYPDGVNPEMGGDYYDISQPSNRICPAGWRLPYNSEVMTLAENLKWATNAAYLDQAGGRAYFPVTSAYNSIIRSGSMSIPFQKDPDVQWQEGDVYFVRDFILWYTARNIIPVYRMEAYQTAAPSAEILYNTTRCVR